MENEWGNKERDIRQKKKKKAKGWEKRIKREVWGGKDILKREEVN